MYGPYAVTSSRRATIAWTLAAKSFVHKDIVHRLFKFVCELRVFFDDFTAFP